MHLNYMYPNSPFTFSTGSPNSLSSFLQVPSVWLLSHSYPLLFLLVAHRVQSVLLDGMLTDVVGLILCSKLMSVTAVLCSQHFLALLLIFQLSHVFQSSAMMLGCVHVWRGWSALPIWGWALNNHLFSSRWPVMSLWINWWPPQRETSLTKVEASISSWV